MSAKRSLRRRIAITLAMFGGLLSLLVCSSIYVLSHDLERRLIDDTLSAELDDLIQRRQRNPQAQPEQTPTIRAYVFADPETSPSQESAPEALLHLPPGYHKVNLQRQPYRAKLETHKGQNYVVLYHLAALQRRERALIWLLFGSVVLATLISAASGHWLAGQVLSPLNRLLNKVAELRPDQPAPALAEQFPWDEINRLAADFDTYLARLQAFVERERLFTGDISHELRTPLTVASGASELLLTDPSLSPKARQRAERILRATTEMTEMTAALLALAREQNNQSVDPVAAACDVVEVVEQLIERHRELLGERPVKIKLQADAHPQVATDHAVLAMVFGNLLRNALNFTLEGEVLVRVRDKDIEIHDSGSGIAEEDLHELFKPYVKGLNSTGSGVGLSLVQRLCQRYGWRVSLEALAAGGTLARLEWHTSRQ